MPLFAKKMPRPGRNEKRPPMSDEERRERDRTEALSRGITLKEFYEERATARRPKKRRGKPRWSERDKDFSKLILS